MKTSGWILLLLFLSFCPLRAQEEDSHGLQRDFHLDFFLDFSLTGRNIGDAPFSRLSSPGFPHGKEEDQDVSERGFSLNYGELALSSTLDHHFEIATVLHLREDRFEIEEAWVRIKSLPAGFQVQAGKFLSAFGRINGQHAHYWRFANRPLPVSLMLGEEGLAEKGIRLSWTLPLSLRVGTELLNGENGASFSSQGNAPLESAPAPRLITAFLKGEKKIGKVLCLYGLSWASGKERLETFGNGVLLPYRGNSRLYGADMTIRYSLDSGRYLSLTGEGLWRERRGDLLESDGSLLPGRADQGGLFLEMTWKFSRRWEASGRWEEVAKNKVEVGGRSLFLPKRLSAWRGSLEFFPTESSRLRLELLRDLSHSLSLERRPYTEIRLSLNIVGGGHKGHSH